MAAHDEHIARGEPVGRAGRRALLLAHARLRPAGLLAQRALVSARRGPASFAARLAARFVTDRRQPSPMLLTVLHRVALRGHLADERDLPETPSARRAATAWKTAPDAPALGRSQSPLPDPGVEALAGDRARSPA